MRVSFVAGGQQLTVWAYVDTQFDGLFAIPESEAAPLGTPDRTAAARLADDRHVETPVYMGSVQIVGVGTPAAGRIIALGSEYILGRAIIDRLRLTLDRGVRLIAEA